MKCSYCGIELTGNEVFCGYCGTRRTPAPLEEAEAYIPEIVDEICEPALAEVPAAEPVMTEEVRFIPEEALTMPEEEFPFVDVPVGPVPQQEKRAASRLQLPNRRSLAKMVFLGILTLGIYPTVIWSRVVTELNLVTCRYDGERTMPYFAMVLLAPFTLGIHSLVWMHGFCRRIGTELGRRKLRYDFGARHFWLWNVLGSLILVGPFIFLHKLMKAMNLLNADYNING